MTSEIANSIVYNFSLFIQNVKRVIAQFDRSESTQHGTSNVPKLPAGNIFGVFGPLVQCSFDVDGQFVKQIICGTYLMLYRSVDLPNTQRFRECFILIWVRNVYMFHVIEYNEMEWNGFGQMTSDDRTGLDWTGREQASIFGMIFPCFFCLFESWLLLHYVLGLLLSLLFLIRRPAAHFHLNRLLCNVLQYWRLIIVINKYLPTKSPWTRCLLSILC